MADPTARRVTRAALGLFAGIAIGITAVVVGLVFLDTVARWAS